MAINKVSPTLSFPTQFRERKRFLSNVGSPIKSVLAGSYDENGNFQIVEKAKDNLYAQIQSYAESVDINVILKRFANGDTSVLNKHEPMYGDFTELPKTYAEMLNVVIAGENYFNQLPLEEREKHGNSFAQFLSNYDKISAAGIADPSPAAPKSVEDVQEGVVNE